MVSQPHACCGPSGFKPRHRAWLLGRLSTATEMGLATDMGMENAVITALKADVHASISQGRHDLPRRQCRELGLVGGQQDPPAFFLAQAVGHQAMTAFTDGEAISATSELPSSALQRGQPYPQQGRALTRLSTGRQGGIEVLRASRISAARVSPPRPRPSRPGSFF